jgi:putative iron-regulated protein
MLTGAITLTSFELAGERLAVAYETRDQEQEHSCFSDTTCDDLVANQRGIDAIFRGGLGEPTSHDLLGLVRGKDPAVAELLAARLDATMAALRAIPAPFDQAFLGPDDGPGRTAIRRAITALEEQAEAIAIAGGVLGYDLPLRRGN